MTNPQDLNGGADYALGGQRSSRLLLLVPLVAGAVVALLLLVAWLIPQLQRLNRDQQRLAAMEEKAQRLPLLRGQLQKTIEAQERATAQRRQLLGLIAGSGSLQTFMAQVNREAERHGVTLDVLQPAAPPPPAPDTKAGAKAAGKPGAAAAAPAAGGCGALGTTAGLTANRQSLAVRGRYPNLLAFMRALERLNLLVVQCDLALEQPASQAGAGDGKAPPPLQPMLLRFELSLYEQGPAAAP